MKPLDPDLESLVREWIEKARKPIWKPPSGWRPT